MRIKSFFAVAAVSAAAIFVLSCTTEDPYAAQKAALVESIAAENGELQKVTFDTFEVVDSATFADELRMRKNMFALKGEQAKKMHSQLMKAGRFEKLAEKMHDIKFSDMVLEGLDSLEQDMGDKVNQVAYYDYCFTAHIVKADNQRIDAVNFYACITPDCKVLKYAAQKKDLHKVTGRVIPGYLKLVRSED